MEVEKEQMRKVYAGYALGEEYCQISLFAPGNSSEPISVTTRLGGEKINIPMVLAKKKQIEQWYYGEEAIRQIELGQAIAVENLYKGSMENQSVEIEGKKYKMVLLLQMYLRKTFGLLLSYVPLEKVQMCTFAVDKIDADMVQMWKTIIEGLPIEKSALRLISYGEGFAYYVAFQEEISWERGAVLFECKGKDKIISRVLTLDKGTLPHLLFVEEKEWEIPDCNDETFFDCAKALLSKIKASVIYLVGEEFAQNWYPETLKLLCQGRRVFRGQNLYGLGALNYSGIKLGVKNEDYLYLGEEQIHVNFFLKAVYQGEETDYELLSAESHWFEAEKIIDFVPDKENQVAVYARGLDGKCEEVIRVLLNDFPIRDEGASRLRLKLHFPERYVGAIEVEDLGFGEIYVATHKVWEEKFDLRLLREKLNGNLKHIKER